MKSFLDNIMPENDVPRKWVAIGLTVIIAGVLTIWAIYGAGDYGVALFVLVPLFIGANATVLYGYDKDLKRKEAFLLGFLALAFYLAGLILFAIEGLICIAMAAPFGIILTWLGCLLGHGLISKVPNGGPPTMLLLALAIPVVSFIERGSEPELTAVVTSIEIEADPETVWKNVVEFPELDEPNELLFKAGIAYPINAKIEGKGVGAIRNCNFTTGSFVEPITVWDQPRLLSFDVQEQPAPMKEISFWDVDAPHLHDYFVSKKGQFKLTKLPNGHTLLEGTTWYYHNINPAFYWRLWSNAIVHKIHERVLKHIKRNAER
ncbi:hypothetical protein [Paraflavitalea sp. CAU 1676]|uniref:hypothetical protein n=1 Tax=Paraflavitalea sp. CAU 1676 TaxID=3032598 RepID=UPI0023DC8CDC|nr:hypothetical protein [Paraflavitalea sp. CAU 1676]MDF2188377.1 hypothetical protein [Paraflavitalea sp. CAU 1676]